MTRESSGCLNLLGTPQIEDLKFIFAMLWIFSLNSGDSFGSWTLKLQYFPLSKPIHITFHDLLQIHGLSFHQLLLGPCIFVYTYIFLNKTYWVQIMLLVCMFSVLTISMGKTTTSPVPNFPQLAVVLWGGLASYGLFPTQFDKFFNIIFAKIMFL